MDDTQSVQMRIRIKYLNRHFYQALELKKQKVFRFNVTQYNYLFYVKY